MQENLSDKCIEFLDKQLEHINSWLTFAEAKNAALIALNITVIGVVFEQFSENKLPATILIIAFAFSALTNLISFWPNNTSRPPKHTGHRIVDSLNLAFWGDIATVEDEEQYLGLVTSQYFPSLTIEDEGRKLFTDLASEIVINSRIATWKYKLFKFSLCIDIWAFVFFCICIIIA